MPRIAALIPAAGRGFRAGQGRNKLLLPMGGEPAIVHTLRALHGHPAVAAVSVIAAEGDIPELERLFGESGRWPKLQPWVPGGAERQDSVWNGLLAMEAEPPDWVLVHDGARPCCSAGLIDRVLAALGQHAAAVPVLPIEDTVRRIEQDSAQVLDRTRLFRIQTPQGFHWTTLLQAHRSARQRGMRGTDDAQLVEALRVPVAFVQGEARNIKLTAAVDFQFGAWVLAHPEWGI
jgi:2-C-methyl-D-erythritol 4-phosphate cytidylyltransferase